MNRTFSAIAAYRPTDVQPLRRGRTRAPAGRNDLGGFFEILGVNPVMGRTFRKEEDRRGAAPTAMISEGLWKRKFGSARNIIGQRLIVDGVGRTVIGVVPSSFRLRIQNFQRGASLNDIYTPIGEFNEPLFYCRSRHPLGHGRHWAAEARRDPRTGARQTWTASHASSPRPIPISTAMRRQTSSH